MSHTSGLRLLHSRKPLQVVLPLLLLLHSTRALGLAPPGESDPPVQPTPPAESVRPEEEVAPEEPPPGAEGAPEEPPPTGPVVVPPEPLEVPQAEYPAEALEAGLEGAVPLVLDILEDGTVGEVTVQVPVGHGFDEAAVEAMKRMRFRPATVDGVPTRVRILYTYRFTLEVVELPPPPPPPPVLLIEGPIVERGTRRKLSGIPVVIIETGETVLTDDSGWFRIEGPAGDATYHLEVVVHGYNPETQEIRVREGKVSRTRFRLTRDIYTNYRTVIREPRIPKEVTKKQITAAEIQRIPGNSGDALKVVQLLPGVARGAWGSGDPIVRGSGPEDTRIFLEGQEMPFLFHFGGLYSVINTDLLESVDFWPGGFGPEYGLATGGAIEVRLRPLQTDRWHGLVETNVYHSSVLVEGPVGEKTAVAFGVRRSYVDAVLKAVVPPDVLDFTVAPRYFDYQFRLTHEFSPRQRFSFFWYGADDALEIFIDEPAGRDGIFAGRLATDFEFHLGTAKWEWDIRPDLRLDTTVRVGLISIEFFVGIFELDLYVKPLDLRTQLDWAISRDLNLRLGVQAAGYIFGLDYFGPSPPKEGEPQSPPDIDDFRRQSIDGEPGVGLAPYVELNWRIADSLTLSPGFRTDTIIGEGYGYTSFDPRFSFRWDVMNGLAVKGFWGLYHQPPEGDEWDDQIGNPDLGPEESMSVSLGAEHKITEHLSVDLQFFRKWMNDLIVPADREIDGVSLLNRGQGKVKGLEFMLRHQSSERFFGWLTYTLMKAERQDEIDVPWRPFDFDQTHILNLVGVVRFPRGWEAGLRFRYVTGNPYDPVVGAVFDADGDTYLPTYGPKNSGRVADFHQLDLRVDKKWVFDEWMLDVFVEVQNVYLQPNPEGIAYSHDYRQSRPITGIPIFPNLGVKADF